ISFTASRFSGTEHPRRLNGKSLSDGYKGSQTAHCQSQSEDCKRQKCGNAYPGYQPFDEMGGRKDQRNAYRTAHQAADDGLYKNHPLDKTLLDRKSVVEG